MSDSYAALDDLLAATEPETRDVDLPNGKQVKVRGMSRMELILTRKGTEDPAVIEQRMLAYCMVVPTMTAKQAEAWQKASPPMVIAPVTEAIRELSGLGEGADKSDPGTAGDD
jgi:CxxC motif-containing protein (DUF1111 family)